MIITIIIIIIIKTKCQKNNLMTFVHVARYRRHPSNCQRANNAGDQMRALEHGCGGGSGADVSLWYAILFLEQQVLGSGMRQRGEF